MVTATGGCGAAGGDLRMDSNASPLESIATRVIDGFRAIRGFAAMGRAGVRAAKAVGAIAFDGPAALAMPTTGCWSDDDVGADAMTAAPAPANVVCLRTSACASSGGEGACACTTDADRRKVPLLAVDIWRGEVRLRGLHSVL